MSFSRRFYLYWIIIVVASLTAVILNLRFPAAVETIFQNNNFELLNKLAHTHGERALDYYQGRIEDQMVGPLTNVLSFAALICFCLMYVKEFSFFQFALLIFIFLILSKFNILFFPPYGDAIGGPLAEALWLKDNHFNYMGLFHQPGYLEGGQKVYIFTIYPTYLAILYKLIPSIQAFLVVNHLLVYAMAAVVISASRIILMKSLDGLSAALGSLTILALPLFQSQTEAINMEMPQLFFTVLSVWALVRKDILKAGLWAVLALSIKGLGVVICAAVFLVAVYLFLKDEKFRYDRRILAVGITTLICAFLGLGSKYFVNDAHVSQGMVKLLAGWASLKIMKLPVLFAGSAGLLGVYLLWKKSGVARDKEKEENNDWLTAQIIILLMCALCLLLFLNFKAVSPRYKLGLQPFLVISMIFSLTNFLWLKQWAKLLLAMVVLIISFGSFGKYDYALQANYHVLSERSLEYRNNVKLDMKISKFLEENFHSFAIGAPFIYAQMLNIPELGYVQKPLNVIQYGFPVRYGTIKPFEGLEKLDIMKTVWLGIAADYQTPSGVPYPAHPRDKILKEFILGDNKAMLFMGGFAIQIRWQMIRQILLERQLGIQ